MTLFSPEMTAGEGVRDGALVSESSRRNLDPVLVIILARLNCLSGVSENPEKLVESFAAAVRDELSSSIGVSQIRARIGLWLGFRSFSKTLCSETDDFTRDVLMCRHVLSQAELSALFEEGASWAALYKKSHQRLLDSLASADAQGTLMGELSAAYKAQRDEIVREVVLKTLPTLVLALSTLIAVVMAAVVWRSLFISQ
ncbi:MAG: hypothetical protein RL189_3135 [Pseudomonadota bacterium]